MFLKSVFLNHIINIFQWFYSRFGDFWSLLEDIEPFFRLDLGGELGDGYQLDIHIKQALLRPWEGFRADLC
jgi:hypothetical protein